MKKTRKITSLLLALTMSVFGILSNVFFASAEEPDTVGLTQLPGSVYYQHKIDMPNTIRVIFQVAQSDMEAVNSALFELKAGEETVDSRELSTAYKSIKASGKTITAPEGDVYVISPAYEVPDDANLSATLSVVTYDLPLGRDFNLGGATVDVTGVELNKTETTLNVGESETLTAMVTPGDATDKTVTWNMSDITGGSESSFTKDGITVTANGFIDFHHATFMGGGTFTTASGKFTKIEVTAVNSVSGTGWSGDYSKRTWTGDASSSVSFSGDIRGDGMSLTIVFTIEDSTTAL